MGQIDLPEPEDLESVRSVRRTARRKPLGHDLLHHDSLSAMRLVFIAFIFTFVVRKSGDLPMGPLSPMEFQSFIAGRSPC